MTSPSPAESPTKDQTDAIAEPDFATEVQNFWEKKRTIILSVCAAVLLAIIGYKGWEYLNEMRDTSAREAYAKAAASPERLTVFAAEYASHPLASVALLQAADVKYSAGDFAAALNGYQKAAAVLANPTLNARARLGAGVSRLGSGDQAGAQADLKSLGADVSVDKSIRAEATYHLATLANDAGRTEEARQLLDEVTKLDATGLWAERALQLQTSLMPQGANSLLIKP